MAETFKLEITTPERLVVSVDAESAQIPGKAGYMGILPHHAALISELAAAPMEYVAGGRTEKMAISAGYVEVLPNRVSILAETAEKQEEIDVARADSARKRAEERMSKSGKDIDIERAGASLARAMARLLAAKK